MIVFIRFRFPSYFECSVSGMPDKLLKGFDASLRAFFAMLSDNTQATWIFLPLSPILLIQHSLNQSQVCQHRTRLSCRQPFYAPLATLKYMKWYKLYLMSIPRPATSVATKISFSPFLRQFRENSLQIKCSNMLALMCEIKAIQYKLRNHREWKYTIAEKTANTNTYTTNKYTTEFL